MRSEIVPFTQTSASSTGSRRFTVAVAMPADPEAEIGNVMWFPVWKTRRKSSWTPLMNSVNQGSTCPTSGAAIARYTRGLTQDGPGVSISLVGGRNSCIGSDILDNLYFRAERQRTTDQVCHLIVPLLRSSTHLSRSNRTRSGRTGSSVKEGRPRKILVCSIPGERATANMVLRMNGTNACANVIRSSDLVRPSMWASVAQALLPVQSFAAPPRSAQPRVAVLLGN